LFSGCYDSIVRLWQISELGKEEAKPLLSLSGHNNPISALSSFSKNENQMILASSSKDQTIRVWDIDMSKKSGETMFLLKGHTNGVLDCDIDPAGLLLVSGSWDNSIMIWSLNEDPEDENVGEPTENNKKRKVERSIKQKKALFSFEGHTQPVSAVSFGTSQEVISGSWDYSIRFWDIEKAGTSTETLNGNKAILSLSYNHTSHLVATGHIDKAIRVWDKRLKETEVCKSFRSHTSSAYCVQWHPTQEFCLISGGYDNTVKVWDIRSKTCMYTITNSHTDKVLSLTWINENLFASGSADSTIKTHYLK